MNNLVTIEAYNIQKARPSIEAIVDQFINSQDVKKSSKDLYRRTLKQFFNWMEDNKLQLIEVSRVEILRYKDSLLERGLSPLGAGSYLTSVRKFFEWAEANKYYPNVAKGVKAPKRKRKYERQPLSVDQSKDLLAHFQNKALRDYAVVNLLLRTGLRTIETIRADIGDITYKGDRRVLLIHGKGRDAKDQFVILTDKAYKPIEEYLATKGKAKKAEPLFTSQSNNSFNQRLTTKSISRLVKEGLRSIGIDSREYTAHSLRHTTAVSILKAGGALSDAQAVLRHSDPATTQMYTETIKEELRLKNAPEALIDNIF